MGDFNVTDDEHHMKSFRKNYDLKNQATNNPINIQVIQHV